MLGTRSFPEKLAIIRTRGFDGVDGRYETLADPENRRALRESGLPVGAMYSQVREPGVLSRTAAERAEALEMIVSRATLAAAVGARSMVVVPIFGPPKMRGFDSVMGPGRSRRRLR